MPDNPLIHRYAPDLSLPPYAYVPGLFPHPHSDSDGHHVETPRFLGDVTARGVLDSGLMRRGIDLFHHGYYWEAHEAWETLWLAVGKDGPQAGLLKGLIKLTAAGVKARQGLPVGIQRHAARASQLLEAAQQSRQNLEFFDLPELVQHTRSVAEKPEASVNRSSARVVVVFKFSLPYRGRPVGGDQRR